MKERRGLIELAVTLAVVAVSMALVKPSEPRRFPSPTASVPTTVPHSPDSAYVSVAEFQEMARHLKGGPYRLGVLTPAAQALFEGGQLLVPKKGVWVDPEKGKEGWPCCGVLVAQGSEAHPDYVFVNPMPANDHVEWVPYPLKRKPESFDKEFIFNVFSGRV